MPVKKRAATVFSNILIGIALLVGGSGGLLALILSFNFVKLLVFQSRFEVGLLKDAGLGLIAVLAAMLIALLGERVGKDSVKDQSVKP